VVYQRLYIHEAKIKSYNITKGGKMVFSHHSHDKDMAYLLARKTENNPMPARVRSPFTDEQQYYYDEHLRRYPDPHQFIAVRLLPDGKLQYRELYHLVRSCDVCWEPRK